MELLFNTDESHRQIAERIQKQWEENLGIHIKLLNQEWKVYLNSQRKLDYDICRAAWIGDYLDPNTFLAMFITGGGHNRTGWSNARYDRLIEQAERETNPAKRMALFRAAEAILMDELPILPIFFYHYQNLIHPSIRGHRNNPLNSFDFRRLKRVHRGAKLR